MMIFFDKNGSAWATCSPEYVNAHVFPGPEGWTFRQVGKKELSSLGLSGNHPPLIIAQEFGRVTQKGEFYILK
jgi:hypothetical protein